MESVKVEMSSMTTLDTCVAQVTNVAPAATLEQMSTLFGFLGKIEEIKLYPSEDYPIQPSSRICYVKYEESWSVGVSQHLTNTVFIDRALIVVPVVDGIIPDESQAMSLAAANVPGILGSGPSHLINQVTGLAGAQVVTTVDPALTALGLPQYPPLPGNTDPAKIEEIRRTIYVGNLGSGVTAEQLLKFFNHIGEVKYVRMAGDETQPTRFAFVEFTEQTTLTKALQYNGFLFAGRPLKVNHSNNAIVKPQAKSSEAAQREIEEAMKRVREAQSLITAAIEPGIGVADMFSIELMDPDKKKERSKTHSRSRSRSRKRSSSRSRSRKRSRSIGKKSSSRSRTTTSSSRRRSRSRSHRRNGVSPASSRKKLSRSRSKSKDKRSKKSVSPKVSRREHSRSHSKDRKKRSRRSRSRSPGIYRSSKSSKTSLSSKRDYKSDRKKSDRSPKHGERSSPKLSDRSRSRKDDDRKSKSGKVSKRDITEADDREIDDAELNLPIEKNKSDQVAEEVETERVVKTENDPLSEQLVKTDLSEEGMKEQPPCEESPAKERSLTPLRERSPGETKIKSPRRKMSVSPPRPKIDSPSPPRKNRHRSRSRSPSGRKPKRSRRTSRSPSLPPIKSKRGRRGHSRSFSPPPLRRRSPRSRTRSRSRSRSLVRHKHRSPPRHRSRTPRRSPSFSVSGRRRRSISPRGRSPRGRSRSPRPRRSRTPMKRRSRTPKKDSSKHKKKKSDHDRSRDKERSKDKKKRKHKDDEFWDEKIRHGSSEEREKSLSSVPVVRNYDEEEKGYDSSDDGGGLLKLGIKDPLLIEHLPRANSESSSGSSKPGQEGEIKSPLPVKTAHQFQAPTKRITSDTESDQRSQQMDLDSD